MKAWSHILFATSLSAFVPWTSTAIAAETGDVIKDTTQVFIEDEAKAEQQLAKVKFFDSLITNSFNAKIVEIGDVNGLTTMPNLGRGDTKSKYDVILQPGHYGRTKETGGNLGTAGAMVSEQKLAAYIVAQMSDYLKAENVNVLVVQADDFEKSGLNAKIFLSVHFDGSNKPCSTGPSMGYKTGSSLLGMHSIGFALATSMGQSYADFQKDNFTVDEHDYYAFKYMNTTGFSGLLEAGELTCTADEKKLIAAAALIGHNLGVALKADLDILNEPLDGGN
jgi:hypothetical protein